MSGFCLFLLLWCCGVRFVLSVSPVLWYPEYVLAETAWLTLSHKSSTILHRDILWRASSAGCSHNLFRFVLSASPVWLYPAYVLLAGSSASSVLGHKFLILLHGGVLFRAVFTIVSLVLYNYWLNSKSLASKIRNSINVSLKLFIGYHKWQWTYHVRNDRIYLISCDINGTFQLDMKYRCVMPRLEELRWKGKK